jgi:hypothetical protein
MAGKVQSAHLLPEYQEELRELVQTQVVLGGIQAEMVRAQREIRDHLWWVELGVKIGLGMMSLGFLVWAFLFLRFF